MLGVMWVGGDVVVHVEGDRSFVLHVSHVCSGEGWVSSVSRIYVCIFAARSRRSIESRYVKVLYSGRGEGGSVMVDGLFSKR